jgi:CTP:phosphocholine cytidylyltransferase-like protein
MRSMTTLDMRREDLVKVGRRAELGGSIPVTHRGQYCFSITYERPKSDKPVPGSKEAMANFLKEAEEIRKMMIVNGYTPDPNKSIKELYDEAMQNDPKYSQYFPK